VEKRVKVVFWALVGAFAAFIGAVFGMPLLENYLPGSLRLSFPVILAGAGSVLLVLGIVFLVLTKRGKVKGKLRRFQLLTGASAIGIPVGVVLHNALYALGEITSHIAILSQSLEVLHTVFFLLAIPICLVGFLVGAIGTIILYRRTK